jgi:RNA polymerase sigma factor (sigma-70 family)
MLHTHTPYRLLSDERLARHAAARDDRAFSVLYKRHESALLAYCRSITREPEDARDALQSAMASAYAAIPARVPGGPVRAWLFKIAHNEAIDLLRRRRDELPLADADLTLVPSAADQTTQREAAHEALAEVAQLPPRQRGALVMRELHGLGYDEIATALSVSEVNARQLVFAARTGVADSRAGRNLPCEFVRDAIEAGDRRAQRRRRLRAHLRSCDDCRAYAKVSRPAGRRAALALPGGWIAGWGQSLGAGGASLTASAGDLMAPAKGVAVVAVAAAVAAATASHDQARPAVAKAEHPNAARGTAAKARVAAASSPPDAAVVGRAVTARAAPAGSVAPGPAAAHPVAARPIPAATPAPQRHFVRSAPRAHDPLQRVDSGAQRPRRFARDPAQRPSSGSPTQRSTTSTPAGRGAPGGQIPADSGGTWTRDAGGADSSMRAAERWPAAISAGDQPRADQWSAPDGQTGP